MKKILIGAASVLLLLALLFWYYRAEPEPMEIVPVGEEALGMRFDFTADPAVEHLIFSVYRLTAGEWMLQEAAGDRWTVYTVHGTIHLPANSFAEPVILRASCGKSQLAFQYQAPTRMLDGLDYLNVYRSEPVPMAYDQEIPLMIQILPREETDFSCDVDAFFHPETFKQVDYEGVYAITVKFLNESLS